MVSINTTSSNRAVLASLRQTNAEIEKTQTRIATGYKVASAKDNAAVWAVASSIRSDIDAQTSIDTNIATAKAQTDVAVEVLNSMQDILTDLATVAADAVLHSTTGATAINNAVQAKVARLQAQLLALAKSATFQGKNLLTTATALEVKIGSDNGADITLDFTSTQVLKDDGSAGTLGSGTAAAFTNVYKTKFNDSTDQTTVLLRDAFIDTVNDAKDTLSGQIAELSSFASTLETQQDFSKTLTDIRKSALSALVDADMEEESAKVQSLQVKQQLAYQALAIGNGTAQNILTLFR